MSAPFESDLLHPERGIVDLEQAIRLACPILGVSVGRWGNRSTWRIDFDPIATPEQREAAQKALMDFKPQDAHPEGMTKPVVLG